MRNRVRLAAISTAVVLGLAACGGGGSGGSIFLPSDIAIKGTAASGGSLNGVVFIKDSKGLTANTNTDSNGVYQFTTSQLAGMTAPYMLEIVYQIGGVQYYLNSAATGQDLSSGTATINITPLTDLVVANLAHDIASNVFNNGNFSSLLTPTALSAGASALAAQLQPLLAAQGVNGTVDLLHDSFTANSGTGLDAVLDALKVTVDPATKTAIIANRLNNTSITNDLTKSNTENTTKIATSGGLPLTDLQSISARFDDFSALMAKAPKADDAALTAYFDQSHFLESGKTLAQFLQQITTSPTVAGGALSFSDITLEAVPSWVTTVPSTATAQYLVRFRVMKNAAPSGREAFVVYKSAAGAWLLLGNQKIAAADIEPLATASTNGSSAAAYCTGLMPRVEIQGGSAHISYAVITGPGLPSAGLLLFNPSSTEINQGFEIAAGDVTTYTGINTPMRNSSACGFSSLYALNDAALQSTTSPIAAGSQYTYKLYDDKSTPSNRTDDVLLATYRPTLPAAPLLNTQLNATRFVSIPTDYQSQWATIVADAKAATVQSFTAHWTAPTATGLYATQGWINVSSSTQWSSVNAEMPWNATSATVAIPLLPNANHVDATLDYVDAGLRHYWSGFHN